MRSALSILVLFSFLIVNMSKSIILINYQLNKAEITAKYCVNKDKPQMHCCGKCLLKKKMAEQEAQQNFPAFPDVKTDMQLSVVSCQLSVTYPDIQRSELNFQQLALHSLFEGTGVFHPPSC